MLTYTSKNNNTKHDWKNHMSVKVTIKYYKKLRFTCAVEGGDSEWSHGQMLLYYIATCRITKQDEKLLHP